MEAFTVSAELQFREEAMRRTLQEYLDNDDIEGLMTAALLLNTLWNQQSAISAWLGREAALNLAQAWQSPGTATTVERSGAE